MMRSDVRLPVWQSSVGVVDQAGHITWRIEPAHPVERLHGRQLLPEVIRTQQRAFDGRRNNEHRKDNAHRYCSTHRRCVLIRRR